MLDKQFIESNKAKLVQPRGVATPPVLCAVSGQLLDNEPYITRHIGSGWKIRYKAKYQGKVTDDMLAPYKALVPETTTKTTVKKTAQDKE